MGRSYLWRCAKDADADAREVIDAVDMASSSMRLGRKWPGNWLWLLNVSGDEEGNLFPLNCSSVITRCSDEASPAKTSTALARSPRSRCRRAKVVESEARETLDSESDSDGPPKPPKQLHGATSVAATRFWLVAFRPSLCVALRGSGAAGST